MSHLLQKGGAHRIDIVRRENARGQLVHGGVVPRLLIVPRHAIIIKVLPELRGINAAFLDLRQRQFLSVDIVDREERGNAETPGGGGDEPRHPVIAVDEVRLHAGDDVVQHLPLEGEGDARVLPSVVRVNRVPVVKDAVLREVDALLRQPFPHGFAVSRLKISYTSVWNIRR